MKKNYTQKEILDLLPENWSQIKFKTYLELMKLKVSIDEDPVEILNSNLEVCSLFLDLPTAIVEQFPMSTIKAMNNRLAFLSEKAKPIASSKYLWKTTITEPTYDDFITFIKVSEQINQGSLDNFPLLIKIMLKKEMTEEEILNMSMDEVEHGFFLLRKYSMNYLKLTMKDLTVKAIAMKTNEMIETMRGIQGIQFKTRLRILREKYKELTDGISSQKRRQTSQISTTLQYLRSQQ